MNQSIRIGNKDSKHLYVVEVEKDGARFNIEVDANNRNQANRIASDSGYIVRSVNMVG